MKTYHLPCGIKFGALNEYYGNFDSYCPSHRSKREVKPVKSKSKNYVLTDLGLVPEHVDREAGFDSEKYKDMLRKIEKQYGEKKKEVKVKQENDPDARKRRETSDEEVRTRPGPKSRTSQMKKKADEDEDEERSAGKKKKEVSEEREGVRRGGRERKTFGSDIYKSAKEELEAMLKKKELVNLSDTFTNLAGTRRATKSIYNKGVGEEEEEDTSRRSKKGRSSRGAMGEVDDEGDEEDFRSRRGGVSFARDRRPARKSPECDSEEEENKSFKKIMKKKKSKVNDIQSEGEESTRRDSPRSKVKKESSESEEDWPKRSRKNKKVLTPEPEEVNAGEWSVKVKISEPHYSEQEEEPRRKPGPKSRRPLTPQQKESLEENTKRPTRKGKQSQENGRKEASSDEDIRLPTPQPKMSDSEEEEATKKKKDCESIESIEEFLVGGRLLERKGSTESNSDSGNRKQKIRLTKVKKPTVDSGDEEAGTPPENEFEDAEPDTIQETLAQNDGFVDTSGILSANASDEGADIEKPNFNDDDDEEENFDFSDIITKLDVQIEDKPSWHDLYHCYRFKCKVCDLGNRDVEKLEEHVKTVHNKKIPSKMIKKQEMVVSIERQRLSADDRKMAKAMVAAMSICKIKEKEKVSTPILKNGKKKKMEKAIDDPAELTGERYPFFKYANDEVTIAMIDRGNSCIKARDKTPEKERTHGNRTSLDNIDSLLDDENSPEKETKNINTPRKGKVNLEKVKESEASTDSPKEDEEGVRRGGRVRKTLGTDVYKSAKKELALKKKEAAQTGSDREDEATEDTKRKSSMRKTTSGKDFVLWENDEKSSSTRSSRSSRTTVNNGDEEDAEMTSKKATWKIDYISTASSREGSPSANDSSVDRKDGERGKRSRRKSPPKKILGSAEPKTEGRDCLSPVQSEAVIEGPVFECMKCGTRLKQRKDLVMNHLKLHKLTFESYIGNYNNMHTWSCNALLHNLNCSIFS